MSVLFFISMLNMPNTTGLLCPESIKRSSVFGESALQAETLEINLSFSELDAKPLIG